MLYYFLDITAAKAWLMHKRIRQNKIKLSDFKKAQIADALIKFKNKSGKRGRILAAMVEDMIEAKKRNGPTAHIPIISIWIELDIGLF